VVEVGCAVPDGPLDEDLPAAPLADDGDVTLVEAVCALLVEAVCALLDPAVGDEVPALPPEGDDEACEPVSSACATPDPPANAAPMPSVIAPAPSHE
jgi:hypothetical protein